MQNEIESKFQVSFKFPGKKLSSIDEIGVTTEDKEEKEENDDAILPDDVIVEDGAPLEEEPLNSSNRLTITSSQSRNMSQCSFQSVSSLLGSLIEKKNRIFQNIL